MKKIYLVIVAVLISALFPMQIFAEMPQVVLSNDNGEVKINITNSLISKSADTLIPGIKDCKEKKTQEFTVKAESAAKVALRLEAKSKSQLEAFETVITDVDGNEIYNSTANQAADGDTYKDMPLGSFTSGEEKTYKISYVIKDTSADVSDVSLAVIVWQETEPSPTPYIYKPKSTPKPKFDFDVLDGKDEFVFDFSEVADMNGENENNTAATEKEIKKICGKDIPAGRFSVTGNGKLKITSSAGGVKTEKIISENPQNGESVKTAVVVLEDGDVITITPINGDEKARLKFNKVTTESGNVTPVPLQPTAAAKSNPKTGDGNMGIMIAVGVLAVAAFIGLEVLKRRNKAEK